jgi:hypothetical protein
LSKPIPPDVTPDVSAPAATKVSQIRETYPSTSRTDQTDIAQSDPAHRPASLGNGRPRVKERAEAFVREQLANGPHSGELVKREAAEYAISERFLIAAAERLGVRCRQGQWWLPG